MTEYADLEIGLHRRDVGSYSVEFRFNQPNSETDVRLSNNHPAQVHFDLDALNDLEYEPPTISAASVVGLAVLESGGDAASITMTDLLENAKSAYRFEEIEFLLVADRLAELAERDGACQILKSYVRDFSQTPGIRQKLVDYCE